MEKINFKNATLKKQAYVEINGQKYNVVDSEYTGGTNLDAETLNYAFQLMHPVGSIYMTTVETNPSEIFGFGTWELWGAGKVPVGIDTAQADFNTVEKTGGEKTHTLTIDEMPKHKHGVGYVGSGANGIYAGMAGTTTRPSDYDNTLFINNEGNSQPHNNLQPYITCYMFKRIA